MIYNISYKTLIGSKPLRIRFDKIDEFIKIYDGTRYLVLAGSKKYDAIYNRIRYVLSLTRGMAGASSHSYIKIKVDPSDSLPIKKIYFVKCYNTH